MTDVVRTPASPKKSFWRRVRQPLKDSRFLKRAIATLATGYMSFVKRTNPLVQGSDDPDKAIWGNRNSIFALWHGQHLLIPAFNPPGHPLVTLVSRSADAEINALYVEKFGLTVLRGSGGRDREKSVEKGGIRGLIAMKKALDDGLSVATIADIPSGTSRDAGMGVVTLAKLSGRPIIPCAVATSRRKVFERSWDKTTINLPFGRGAIVFGPPILVGRDTEGPDLEAKRIEVTDGMNAVTEKARRLADGVS